MLAAGVLVPEADCGALSRHIGRALTLAQQASGDPVPELLLDHLDELRRAAESSATFHDDTSRNHDQTGDLAGLTWLTTKEAAERAEVSASYLRRAFRDGAIQAARGARGAWYVDTDSFGAWLASRHEHSPRAA